MSAYACEPGKGSEPWVGWNWCRQMAQLHDVTVVTRANNRKPIEAALENHLGATPNFLYYDLPRPFVSLKKKGLLPTATYYAFWQLGVAIRLRKQVRAYDVIHHVTFNSFVLPGFWWLTRGKKVVGPLGGGMTTKTEYLPLFRGKRWKERLRTLFVRFAVYLPPTYLAIRTASHILCANRETQNLLSHLAHNRCSLLLETACDIREKEDELSNRVTPTDYVTALWVGSLEPRKGLELGLRALARVPNICLEIVGSGDERDYLEKLAEGLRVTDRVMWRGRLSHEEILPAMARSDLFLFTSVRDTSGNVVLEAMSSGLPVVAINHQGVADILNADCGILVTPGTIEQTVDGLAQAMEILSRDAPLRETLGSNGRTRLAEQFSWTKNRDAMNAVYEAVVSDESSHQ